MKISKEQQDELITNYILYNEYNSVTEDMKKSYLDGIKKGLELAEKTRLGLKILA